MRMRVVCCPHARDETSRALGLCLGLVGRGLAGIRARPRVPDAEASRCKAPLGRDGAAPRDRVRPGAAARRFEDRPVACHPSWIVAAARAHLLARRERIPLAFRTLHGSAFLRSTTRVSAALHTRGLVAAHADLTRKPRHCQHGIRANVPCHPRQFGHKPRHSCRLDGAVCERATTSSLGQTRATVTAASTGQTRAKITASSTAQARAKITTAPKSGAVGAVYSHFTDDLLVRRAVGAVLRVGAVVRAATCRADRR